MSEVVNSLPPRPLQAAEVEALRRSERCLGVEVRGAVVRTGEVVEFDLLLESRIVRVEFDGSQWVAST